MWLEFMSNWRPRQKAGVGTMMRCERPSGTEPGHERGHGGSRELTVRAGAVGGGGGRNGHERGSRRMGRFRKTEKLRLAGDRTIGADAWWLGRSASPMKFHEFGSRPERNGPPERRMEVRQRTYRLPGSRGRQERRRTVRNAARPPVGGSGGEGRRRGGCAGGTNEDLRNRERPSSA
jgi:hypothetical protein